MRSLKTIDLDLRPIHHYTATRIKAHVLLCTLAAYLVWHLHQAWAPLTFTDQDRPQPTDPLAPARRSAAAHRKAAAKTTDDDLPARSFTRSLLAALIHSDNCSTDELGASPQPSDGTTTGPGDSCSQACLPITIARCGRNPWRSCRLTARQR